MTARSATENLKPSMPLSPSQTPPSGALSDEMLIQRLRDGAPSAGEELVKRHFRPLMRYLQRLVRDDHLAEEMHQQTWLSVLENLDKFDPAAVSDKAEGAGSFKAWLFRIATNKANDYWRSTARGRAAQQGMKLAMGNEEEQTPPADSRLQSQEQQQRLVAAIEQLPEAQRQVLLLRYYSNLKFVEIARLLGCPLNTALGRMHKAVNRLRTLME